VAGKVAAGLAESKGRYGLTACAPGSAPGPTLGNKYGKPLALPLPPLQQTASEL